MKAKSLRACLALVLLLIFVGGCTTHQSRVAAHITLDRDSVYPEELVTPLPKLTAAIYAEFAYRPDREIVPHDELVTEAVNDNPDLAEAFHNLPIRVKHDSNDVVVLVCSPNGKYAWLEDASWTPCVDKKHYLSDPPLPAEFTIELDGE